MAAPGKRKAMQTTAVERPAQIRALASPARQELLDTLQALGRASVPELAAQLGRPADALYYHVRALQKAGLLREVERRRRGRHVEAVYATPEPDKRLKLSYRAGGKASARAVSSVVASMLRASRRDFDAAIARADVAVDGPRRELWAARVKGWLSPRELARANTLLLELATLVSGSRSPARERLYSFQFLLVPTLRERPARRSRRATPIDSGETT